MNAPEKSPFIETHSSHTRKTVVIKKKVRMDRTTSRPCGTIEETAGIPVKMPIPSHGT